MIATMTTVVLIFFVASTLWVDYLALYSLKFIQSTSYYDRDDDCDDDDDDGRTKIFCNVHIVGCLFDS